MTDQSIDPSPVQGTRFPLSAHVCAWAVHAFTMTGVVWALLAVKALLEGDIVAMWGWLLIALIVDGLDGSLARAARVREVVPWFDGSILDHVIDYMTWTFLPAVFVYMYLPLGGGIWQLLFAVLIAVSSVFCFCNTKMKSSDFYFVGFPAAWNVVAVSLWILHLPAWANILTVVTLSALTLVPWKYLHPFRVRELMAPNIVAVTTWMSSSAWLVVAMPDRPMLPMVAWWVSGAWFLGVSAVRTIRGRPARES
ncbi:MAG: hypothetical protein Q4G40_03920 [Brachybacterium sp.]|nr:hypothetical protein [Brachybacterium sp.]